MRSKLEEEDENMDYNIADEPKSESFLQYFYVSSSNRNSFNSSDNPASVAPLYIVILCALLALGFGSVIGVVPAVMTDRIARQKFDYMDDIPCFDYNSQNNDIVKPEACTKANNLAQDYAAFCSLISNSITFVISALIGSISDSHGRKLLISLGVVLALLPSLALVMIQIDDKMDPLWYYGLNAIGGFVNWFAIALSSLSDVIPKEFRAASFGFLLAGFSLGFALSPCLALTMDHFHVSFVSFLLLFALYFSVFQLPETLPADVAETNSSRSSRFGSSSSIGNDNMILSAILRPVRELKILNRASFFRNLAFLAFFSGLAVSGDRGLLIYYVQDQLNFNNTDIAKLFLILGFLGIAVQAGLLGPLTRTIGEKNVVIICFTSGAIHNVMYGLASTKNTIFFAVIFSTFSGLSYPTISAIKSNNVDESEQGRIQGALYSIASLAAALGPLSLRSVYWKTKDTDFPGLMFMFGASLYLIATFIALTLPRGRTNSRECEIANGVVERERSSSNEGPERTSFIPVSERCREELI